MASRRMFSIGFVSSDDFLDLPHSAQSFYLHLMANADDDGFLSNTRRIMRYTECTEEEFNVLCEKGFIIPFDSGVIVIRHWNVNNHIQKDRYHETTFKCEKSLLQLDDNGVYTLLDTSCIHSVSKADTENSIDKVSIDKVSVEENSIDKTIQGESTPARDDSVLIPSIEEVQAYCDERNNGISGKHFVNYYMDRGWENVNDWKARVRSWETNGIDDKKPNNSALPATTKSGTATVSGDKVDDLLNKALMRTYGE